MHERANVGRKPLLGEFSSDGMPASVHFVHLRNARGRSGSGETPTPRGRTGRWQIRPNETEAGKPESLTAQTSLRIGLGAPAPGLLGVRAPAGAPRPSSAPQPGLGVTLCLMPRAPLSRCSR